MLNVNGNIVGGYMGVIAKKSVFKFYIIPQGPIVKKTYECYLKEILEQVYTRSQKLKCCYVQFSIPFSDHPEIVDYVYSENIRQYVPDLFELGKKFKYIYTGYGINWVNLRLFDDFDLYLKSLKPQVRRNIKLAFKRNDKFHYLSNHSTREDLNEIYKLVSDNAKQFNYSVRHFNDIDTVLMKLLRDGLGFYQNISNNSQIVSSGFSIKCYNHLVYLFGGTIRMSPDTKAGYLVHAMNIKTSIEKGMNGYNISMGGTNGVRSFKAKFNAEAIYFNDPDYHYIHNSFIFQIFKILDWLLKNYKGIIAKYLK